MSNYDSYQHYLGIGMSFIVNKKMQKFDLNDLDIEFSNIFRDSMSIYNSFEKMKMISSLVKIIPDKNFFDEREILEDEYLKYHIENYLTCIISMLDKLSKLLNKIYSMGVKDSECSFKKIINRHLKQLPQDVQVSLCELNVNTKEIRKQRNYITHEGEFEDKNWLMFSGLSYLSRKSELRVPEEQLREEVNREYEKYYKYMSENNKLLSEGVMKILDYMAITIKDRSETTINSWPENIKEIVYEDLKKYNE